ncbi:MAG: DUF503 domain-containing protein [Acidobacteriota bacterium]
MIIGLCSFEIWIPYSRSLKEKRAVIRKIIEKIKPKYNVSISEIDFQNLWQRAKIGIVSINAEKSVIEKVFNSILKDLENSLDGHILNFETKFF